MKFGVLLALVGAASAGFPSPDMFHASCSVKGIVSQSSCTETMEAFKKVFNPAGSTPTVIDFATPPGTYSKKNPPVETAG